jgi:tetratricopeptide (TPR) repeat protein
MSGSSGDFVQARDISGGIHFHQGANRPEVVPAQLPGDPFGFVNRIADLDLLDSLLCPPDGTALEAAVCLITGTPGVGKTSLAIHWAHRSRARFPDGQLYVNLRGYDWEQPVDPQQALSGFLIALGVAPGAVPAYPEDRSSLYRSILSERRTLVLLDNAATTSQVAPLLTGAGRSRVLITSRGLLSGLATRGGARRVTLGLFSEADSVALLRLTTDRYRVGDSQEEVAELAALCARLPLALRIAAERAAARPRMTLSALIQDLRDESSLWNALSISDLDDADAVRSVFAWSYRALPEATAGLFRLLGIFPGTDFSSSAAAAIAGISADTARRILGDLTDAHLVEQLSADRYQFHDLLRAYASGQAQQFDSPEEQAMALKRVTEWYLRSSAAFAKLDPYAAGHRYVELEPPTADTPKAGFADYDQAITWFHEERSNLTSVVRMASALGLKDAAWEIPSLLRKVYDRERIFDDWLAITHLGIEAARTVGSGEGLTYLLESLGRAYDGRGHTALAAECYSELLELSRTRQDFFTEAVTLNVMGLIEIRLHHMSEAISYFEQCDSLCSAHGFRELTVNPATNLAQALLEFGRPDEALTMARIAVETNRQVGSRQAEMRALLSQSAAELQVGEVSVAESCIEQARQLAESSQSRAEIGITQLYAGAVHLALGRTTEALEAYQNAALIARRGGDRHREALSLRGAAIVQRSLGRHSEASDLHRSVLVIWRSLEDRWQTASALAELVTDLEEGDRAPEVRAAVDEALALIHDFSDPAAGRLREFLMSPAAPGDDQ